GVVEHQLDFPPECPGHHGQREPLSRGGADEVHRARYEGHRPADRGGVVEGPKLGWGAQRGRVRRAAVSLEAEAETLAVVEAEILAIVRLPVERDAVLSERRGERLAVLRLVVDDDTVEVEENGPGHDKKRSPPLNPPPGYDRSTSSTGSAARIP